MTDDKDHLFSNFTNKVLTVVGILWVFILLTLLFVHGFRVILLVLGGIMVSSFFGGLSVYISRYLHLNKALSVLTAVILVLGIFTGLGFLLAPRVSHQTDKLYEKVPQQLKKVKNDIEHTEVGSFILARVPKDMQKNNMLKSVEKFFSGLFGTIGDLYIMIFFGVFFLAQKDLYLKGIIRLFPPPKRDRAGVIVHTLGFTIRNWLLGKILSMFVVAILTGVSLWLMGIPLALTLGILAGLLSFIPNFGPLLAFIPAALMAFTISGNYVLYTSIVYAGAQILESNIITPYIQKNMISMPMAGILFAQVLLGIFTGALGLILATPILAIIMVLVKMVYMQDILGDTDVKVKGQEQFEKQMS